MTDDALPELRASDADREKTADLLRHAAGEGRLTMDELDERLDLVYETRTQRELDKLTADVIVPAVSIMSSTSTHTLPSTLPTTSVASATLCVPFGRRLSMNARSASRKA